jgi:spoIIIJ-associated protein
VTERGAVLCGPSNEGRVKVASRSVNDEGWRCPVAPEANEQGDTVSQQETEVAGTEVAMSAVEETDPGESADTDALDAADGGALDDDALDADEDALDADGLDDADALDDADGLDEADGAERPEVSVSDLELEGDIAADYIEGLLDIADLDGDIDMDVEGDRAVVSVVGATLNELVGEDGEVLEALQELTRLAVHRRTGTRARLMLDIGGYRARRRAELAEYGRTVAEEVGRTGKPKALESMSPFERKIVHDAVAAAGMRSESEGEEPNRRVVVFPRGDVPV